MNAAAVFLCPEESYLQWKRVRFIDALIKQCSIESMLVYWHTCLLTYKGIGLSPNHSLRALL